MKHSQIIQKIAEAVVPEGKKAVLIAAIDNPEVWYTRILFLPLSAEVREKDDRGKGGTLKTFIRGAESVILEMGTVFTKVESVCVQVSHWTQPDQDGWRGEKGLEKDAEGRYNNHYSQTIYYDLNDPQVLDKLRERLKEIK